MDLTGQSKLTHTYAVNPNTSRVTVTFLDTDENILGSIEIEEARFRPLMEALYSVSKEMYDEFAPNIQDHRTMCKINSGVSITEFHQ